MRKGNRRDAKFLIFQSLYIIAIAILFFKGTDLSLNYVKEIKAGQIPADPNKILKVNEEAYNTNEKMVLDIIPNDSNSYYRIVKNNETVIDSLELIRLKTDASIKPPPSNENSLRSEIKQKQNEIELLKKNLKECLNN